MAQEFDRLSKNGVVSWKCRVCLVEFVGKQKPRLHLCTVQQTPQRLGAPVMASTSVALIMSAPPHYVNLGPAGISPNTTRPPPGPPPGFSMNAASTPTNMMGNFQRSPAPQMNIQNSIHQMSQNQQNPWMILQQQIQSQQEAQNWIIQMMNQQYQTHTEMRERDMKAQQEAREREM